MSITKAQIIEAIQAMPQTEFNHIDEVIEEIILLEKIENGLKDMEQGNVISSEEMDKIIASW
jgi:predicted transcriptional regulator